MRAASSRAFALWLSLLTAPVFALDPPDHEQWEASMSAARVALGDRDIAALGPAVEGIFEQLIRMREQDPRVRQSGTVLNEAHQLFEAGSRAEFVAMLERLNAITKVPGGLANVVAATPAITLASLLIQDGRFGEARELMRGVAERAAADLGEAHSTVRLARQREASAAVALGDYEGALVALGEALETSRRTFGPNSSEYADILITMARVHERYDDIRRALELADQARALVNGPARQSTLVDVILQLAAAYEDCGELVAARELYQRVDLSVRNALDDEALHIPVLNRLAYLNARLGDGAAARTYMVRASDLGRGAAQRLPSLYVDALFNEAAIYNMAGEYDQAVASIERAESMSGSLSLDQVRALDQQRAWAYLAARRWDRALATGDQLLQAASDTVNYADAAEIVALAAAQGKERTARTELALAAVEVRRTLNPQREPFSALFALAMSYSAEGRIQESADLQKRVIDAQIALRGRYAVGWEQLRTYAATLEQLGHPGEAAEVLARVSGESAPLAAAFGSGASVPAGVFIDEQNAFGFSVQLADARWRRWTGETAGWPIAAFAAQFHPERGVNDATLAVVPVLLPEGLDRDVALAGLLAYLNHDRSLLKPWSKADQSGYEYRFSQTNAPGRPYDYTGRVLMTERGFYLVIAAVFANSSTAATVATQALDQVAVGQRPDPRNLGLADRKLHGTILNNVGVGIADYARLAEALIALGEAREFHVNETLLQNIIFMNLNAGNFGVVVDEVDRYPGGPAAYPKLYLARALSQHALGNANAAIADFRAGFATGLRDDDAASEYVGLLLQEDAAAAVAFLDEYSIKHSSPDILALQALVSAQLEDEGRLQRALVALEDPAQSSAEAALVAAIIHREAGGVGALGDFVRRLPAELISAELYALLAAAQIEVGLFAEARRNVARGIELAPTNPELKALEERLRPPHDGELAL